ncbi:MAG TPA: hypothetical protein DCE78_07350 [Bacteroidetes bacterium]|nr:hypothetical protein [Bacteroidota bacterium]
MKSKSFKAHSPAEITTELDHCMSDGFNPTLAVVFLSIQHDIAQVQRHFNERNIAIFGATTNGEFIDEDLDRGSIAVLLMDIKKYYFHIYFEEFPERNYRETTRIIARNAQNEFKKPAFLIAYCNMKTDAEELLKGFEVEIGEKVNVYGGMAGDDYAFAEQKVFTNDVVSNEGIVVVALDEDKISIKGRATCGWKPIGTPKTVTKSVGNKVYTVDDVPVLDLTLKYGGITNVTRETASQDTALEIATTLPLQLQREVGDPIMRPGLIVDFDDGSFVCSGTVPQGSQIRFSVPPDFDVMELVLKEARDLKDKEIPEADALIVFSCAGRILAFGPMMNVEIEGLRKVWDVPMVGIFSYGELARATNGRLEMHNLTTCCVVLKEK